MNSYTIVDLILSAWPDKSIILSEAIERVLKKNKKSPFLEDDEEEFLYKLLPEKFKSYHRNHFLCINHWLRQHMDR